MLEYLRVKNKTLAAEAKFIRLEEKRAKARRKKELRESLYLHRIQKVRPEARHTHLTIGFLRGRQYRTIEQKAHTSPSAMEIAKMAGRYGNLNEEPKVILIARQKAVEDWLTNGNEVPTRG